MGCNIRNGPTALMEENEFNDDKEKNNIEIDNDKKPTNLHNINDSQFDIKIWNQHHQQHVRSKVVD